MRIIVKNRSFKNTYVRTGRGTSSRVGSLYEREEVRHYGRVKDMCLLIRSILDEGRTELRGSYLSQR